MDMYPAEVGEEDERDSPLQKIGNRPKEYMLCCLQSSQSMAESIYCRFQCFGVVARGILKGLFVCQQVTEALH